MQQQESDSNTHAPTLFYHYEQLAAIGSCELTCTLSWSIAFDGSIADGVLDGDTSMESSSEGNNCASTVGVWYRTKQ